MWSKTKRQDRDQYSRLLSSQEELGGTLVSHPWRLQVYLHWGPRETWWSLHRCLCQKGLLSSDTAGLPYILDSIAQESGLEKRLGRLLFWTTAPQIPKPTWECGICNLDIIFFHALDCYCVPTSEGPQVLSPWQSWPISNQPFSILWPHNIREDELSLPTGIFMAASFLHLTLELVNVSLAQTCRA